MSVVVACAVCMGASDSPLAHGMNVGVLVLLGVTASVLAAFGGGVMLLARRARLVRTEACLVRGES